ncbi:PP2C family protein-serine/threonine phosphatase [Streptomyces sp. NPDC093225]|uniref:PP2C family protein-serine/threonine phosphatase n=1 Tax=Streptomyces sp. NPDC093225 TaxID=3366034 RepID=UPI003823D60D
MPGHATAQLIGDRSHQCDATATFTHEGRRAYVLLDGIGSNDEVRAWTRGTARRLAGSAARSGAGAGLRAVHAALAAEPARRAEGAEPPCAVAVVATTEAGGELEVAWCGDSRAYLLAPDAVAAVRLTTDHNMRRHLLEMGMDPGPYARNVVTSFLGDPRPDPLIDVVRVPALGRLLLASDGAYEPLEDAGRGLEEYLRGPVRRVARELVAAAVGLGTGHADNATVLVADLG